MLIEPADGAGREAGFAGLAGLAGLVSTSLAETLVNVSLNTLPAPPIVHWPSNRPSPVTE
jgi:hypothetical protein